MLPDCLPSAHTDDRSASEVEECAFADTFASIGQIGLDVIYDQALIDDGSDQPTLLHGEFKLVGHTWTDCVPHFLISASDMTIYPFHRVISLRMMEKDGD